MKFSMHTKRAPNGEIRIEPIAKDIDAKYENTEQQQLPRDGNFCSLSGTKVHCLSGDNEPRNGSTIQLKAKNQNERAKVEDDV